jgi:hypothetical protein
MRHCGEPKHGHKAHAPCIDDMLEDRAIELPYDAVHFGNGVAEAPRRHRIGPIWFGLSDE